MGKRGPAKITLEIAEAIKNDPRKEMVVGMIYGVSQSQVSRIKRGQNWPEARIRKENGHG